MAKKKNGFMAKFTDEQKQMMESKSEKVGLSLDKLESLLELAGEFAPVFYSAVVRLLEIVKAEPAPEKMYGSHTECPEELSDLLCATEQAALETLANAMFARHYACCDHHDPDEV
jgi:hypothetical protein